MLKIGSIEINIEGIITVITSILALFFAYLAWKNQVKEKLVITAKSIPLNNNPVLQFDSNRNGILTISNVGYKQITVIDVKICAGKKEISVGGVFDFEKINIPIAPGEVKYYEYNNNELIKFLSSGEFDSKDCIGWIICTNTGKSFKCKTSYHISDVIDVNKVKTNE